MNLHDRIDIMAELANFLCSQNREWVSAKLKAESENPWFTQGFIELSIKNIVMEYLDKNKLKEWVNFYHLDDNINSKLVGLVMAGNIPLVGFHDFLCLFISGHRQMIKPSSKDEALIREIVKYLHLQFPETSTYILLADQLKGCDAYIATGSNNSSRYFEQYFSKYPHIIRKNKTSVAVLTGDESETDLALLAADVQTFFGLGCRSVTKIYVPEGYDFIPLLNSFKKFDYLIENQRYKNNYDYQLSILLLNRQHYMSNDSILLVENDSPFSPISVLNYNFYKPGDPVPRENIQDLQCISGKGQMQPGTLQHPGLFDYADGVDTMAFLLQL